MATASNNTTTAADAATAPTQETQRTVRAKATLDKEQSILFKIKLQDATGKHVPVYEVANKTIGFFCGAGRFAVCQELSALVDRFIECHPAFTLIYISLDTNEGAFNRTMEAHPRWLAVPYNDPIRMDILRDWQTKGVPSLHIYDPIAHEILTSWGGSCLRFNFDNCFQEWKQGREGVTFWQIFKGWWYYTAPTGVFQDMSDEALAAHGVPRLAEGAGTSGSGSGSSSGSQDHGETKKDK